MKNSFLTLLVSIHVFLPFFSFPQSYSFKNYTVEDGLASSTVYQGLQDSKGYIWFVTETGVSRFDGQKFRNFSTQDGLTDNTVLRIREDLKGRIWFITLSSKLFCFFNDTIYLFDKLKKIALKGITDLQEDGTGNLWLGFSGGIIKWQANDSIVLLKYVVPGPNYTVENEKQIWGNTLSSLISINDEKITYYPMIAGIDTISFRKIFFSKDKQMFFHTSREIIAVNASMKQKIIADKHETPGFLSSLFEDSENNFWATTTRGLYFLGNQLSGKNFKNPAFPDKPVNTMMEDKEGGIWISSAGEGVYYLINKNIFIYSKENGLHDLQVTCITGETNGNIWFGTNSGKIYLLNTKKELKEFDERIHQRENRKNTSVMLMRDGGIGFGRNDGILIFKNEKVTRRIDGVTICKSVFEDKDGNIWTGHFGELYQIHNNTVKIIRSKGRITSVFEDKSGIIWFCENAELFSYNGKAFISHGNKNEMLKQRMYFIRQSKDSTFWLATHGAGLVYMKGDVIKNISEHEGLPSNICNSFFIDDDNNNIWVATNKGLSRISFTGKNHDQYTIYNLTTKHGLPSDEINGIHKHHDTVWVATNRGVAFFDEKKIKPNTVSPPVYITRLQIMDGDTAILEQYDLPYYMNNIKIEYVGLTYRSAGNVRYKYQMTGIDTGWVFTNRTFAQYPKLPPGEYIFKVAALNEDGYESAVPTTMSFVIRSPFWKKWWFILLSVLSFIGITIGIANWRIRRSATLARKIAGLELNALRAQMNPHFIFNSLNSIHRYIIKNEEKEASRYLVEFASLTRLILNNSRKQAIPVADEIETLKIYLKLESLRFKDKFEYTIETSENIDADTIEIPPLLIQPFVENAIKHGINYLETKGRIYIRFSLSGNLLICSIEDNGIGRKKAMEIKQAGNMTHQSLGSKITEDRLKILNTTMKNKTSVKYSDLENEKGEPLGTRVEMFIPVQD